MGGGGAGGGGIYRVSRNGMKMLKAEGTVSRYWRRKLVTGSKKKKHVNRTPSLLSDHWVLLGSQVGFSNLRKKGNTIFSPINSFFLSFFFLLFLIVALGMRNPQD